MAKLQTCRNLAFICKNKLIRDIQKAFTNDSDIFIPTSTIFYTFIPVFAPDLPDIYQNVNLYKAIK